MISKLKYLLILLISFYATNNVESSCSFCLNSDKLNETQFKYEKRNVEQVRATKILNNLLKNYRRDLRPGFRNKNSPPTKVLIDINIRSMSKVSEMDMDYNFDCYFRQSWHDERLAYKNGPSMIVINVKLIEKLWKPFTYIVNGVNSFIHTIPSQNKFFRIYKNGTTLLSMRITVSAKCAMNLKNFPIDIQNCPLYITSFVYSKSEVIYEWNKNNKKPIQVAPDLQLSQFDFIGTKEMDQDITYAYNNGSLIVASFKLKRQISYFILQIYVPCILVVLLSWVGFYLDREDTLDRVSLAATTVLTMALLIMENKVDFPKTAYMTALDVYLIVCFGFILSSIIEFAWVHYDTNLIYEQDFFIIYRLISLRKRLLKRCNLNIEKKPDYNFKRSHLRNKFDRAIENYSNEFEYIQNHIKNMKEKSNKDDESNQDMNDLNNELTELEKTINEFRHRMNSAQLTPNLLSSETTTKAPWYETKLFDTIKSKLNIQFEKNELNNRNPTKVKIFNRVSRIDRVARIFYPVSFTLFNIIYWKYYLVQRDLHQDEIN